MDISEEDLKYLITPVSESEDGSLTFDEFVILCQSIWIIDQRMNYSATTSAMI
jgi:hypothetical protein